MKGDCCICGATSRATHDKKIRRGFYKHDYVGPGKHRTAR